MSENSLKVPCVSSRDGHVGFDNDGEEIFANIGPFLQVVGVCCKDGSLLLGEEFLANVGFDSYVEMEEDLPTQPFELSFGCC